MPGAAGEQPGNRLLDAVEHPVDVDPELPPRGSVVLVPQWVADEHDSGVIDHHVQWS
jgi:hypothetical protein